MDKLQNICKPISNTMILSEMQMEGKWCQSKNSKNINKEWKSQEKIGYMFIGEILKGLIVKILDQLVNVFVDIDLKNITLIIFRRDKSTVEEILKQELVNVNSFITFLFVSNNFLLIYLVGS